MADLRISQLPGLGAAALQSDDVVATVDISASETKKITVKDLVQKTVTLIDAGSIPGDKVTFSLPDGSVGTVQLADKSVTGLKLADNSTALIESPLPATGQFIGQLGIDGDDPSIWNGSVWLPFVTGIVSITGGKVGPVTTTATVIGDSASVLAKIDDAAVPAGFVAGPTASAGPVEVRPIVPGDLPVAQTTTAGIVSVPSGGGLAIDGGPSGLGSDLVIDNDIAAGSNQLVSYSTKGLVVGGRAIEGGDLPIATNGSVGAVSAGPEFTVTPAGELSLANIVSPGTFAVVSYNGNGLITAGRDLTGSDIPELDANKITSGTFPSDLLADKSVTIDKLADYSIAYIQETPPSSVDPGHIGVLHYTESTGQLRMWNGNSWMPVGFGRLSNDNLRWGGIIDANNGLMTGVTTSGTNAGLKIGDPLPEATNALGGLYVVIGEPGDQVTVTPGVSYDAGDWCLCINEAEGWTRIDTMTGGGGGGSSTLADLLDVTLTGVTDGQYLQYQASGQWSNVDITAADVGALAPGDNVSELNNDAGYVDQTEVNNILEGKNPDGTPNPGAPEYITSDDLTAAIGDGTISITKSDGTEVGSFTVNQSGDTSIALPADVVPSAPGDGQLEIKDSDGNSLGIFTANQATGTNTEITLPAAASVYWTEGTDQLYPTTASNSILIGGVLPAAPKIVLAADGSLAAVDGAFTGDVTFGNYGSSGGALIESSGSATFKGNVTVGDWDGNKGTRTFPSGAFYVRNNNVSPTAVYKVYKDDTNNAEIEFLNDGSGTFSSTVESGSFSTSSGARLRNSGSIQVRRDGSGENVFEVYKGGTASANIKASINSSGSASFADDVNIGNAGSATGRVGISSPHNRVGLQVYAGSTDGSTNTAEFYNASAGLAASIAGNGAAGFAGNVTLNGMLSPGAGTTGCQLTTSAGMLVTATGAPVFRGYNLNSGTPTSQIDPDGTSKFTSVTATSGSGAKNLINGDGFYQTATDGSTNKAYILNTGNAVFEGKVKAANFDLEALPSLDP